MLLIIGIDKFFPFMDPPCSLENTISPIIWKTLGALQILGAFLICLPKWRKPVAGFFIIFMLIFTTYHISQSTYDIGGSIFMAIQFGIIYWNPSFLGAKK